MKLFVDDLRDPPDDEWTVARTYTAATAFLWAAGSELKEISLDHDLGEEKTGYDFCRLMTDTKSWPPKVRFHSANPVGRKNMEAEYAFYLRRVLGEEKSP